MSSASRTRDSLPPIESMSDTQGDDREHHATPPSSKTDTKSGTESEDSTDRESTPPVSHDPSSRAPSPRTDLTPNPGFSHVRSWVRVPVPPGRDSELAVVKHEFKEYIDEKLPSEESWVNQRRSRRAVFMQEALQKWPVMKCYEDGWPIEAMARQILIDRRSEAKGTRSRKPSKSTESVKGKSKRKSSPKVEGSPEQGHDQQRDKSRKRQKSHHGDKSSRAVISKQTRLSTPPNEVSVTALADASTTLSVAMMSPTHSHDGNMDEGAISVTRLSPDTHPAGSSTHKTFVSSNSLKQDEPQSQREAMEVAFVGLLGDSARSLVPRFLRGGICTLESLDTFVHWTQQEQRTFMKEDIGMTAYEAMDIVHRLARREQ